MLPRRSRDSQAIEASTTGGVRARSKAPAFTLIELLVVIAIIAVLTAIMLPALGKARACTRQTRELAAAHQLAAAFTMYANDYREMVLPGYPPIAWVQGSMGVHNLAGDRLRGHEAQRYPWRLLPYFSGDFRGLYNDPRLLKDVRDHEADYRVVGVDLDYVVSLFPSLGMNATFIGGSDLVQGFDPLFQRVFGRIYVERLDQPRHPSRLLTFASARAELQPMAPTLGRPEGFFRVDPPYFAPAQARRWAASYDERAEAPGLNSGFVSLRHSGKAVALQFDTHAEMLAWDEVGDMRRWSNDADAPDWTLRRR